MVMDAKNEIQPKMQTHHAKSRDPTWSLASMTLDIQATTNKNCSDEHSCKRM